MGLEIPFYLYNGVEDETKFLRLHSFWTWYVRCLNESPFVLIVFGGTTDLVSTVTEQSRIIICFDHISPFFIESAITWNSIILCLMVSVLRSFFEKVCCECLEFSVRQNRKTDRPISLLG